MNGGSRLIHRFHGKLLLTLIDDRRVAVIMLIRFDVFHGITPGRAKFSEDRIPHRTKYSSRVSDIVISQACNSVC